jgi:hypothetical protein
MLAGGYLVLTIKSDIVQLGGFYTKPYASYAGKYVLETDSLGELIYKNPLKIEIPIGNVLDTKIGTSSVKSIIIGGWQYIKFS